jgi:hypothetical protein
MLRPPCQKDYDIPSLYIHFLYILNIDDVFVSNIDENPDTDTLAQINILHHNVAVTDVRWCINMRAGMHCAVQR